jgi:hypothetical protein
LSEDVAVGGAAVDLVGVHYRRTGHQDYTARYVDGRGLHLHCTGCDTRIRIVSYTVTAGSSAEAAAAVKQANPGNQPSDTPSDYPRRTRVNPDRWPYV